MSLSTTVKSIQDIMRKDVGVDGDAQRVSQLAWMLFLKIFDDHESELEVLRDNYKSPLPSRLRWRKWAANDEGITGDELTDFVNNDLFRNLKNLTATTGRAAVLRAAFEDAYNYMKSGTLLRQVINKINEINFNSASDRHLFGDIYEQLLRDLQGAGNAGEYYTPRAVTQFMVDMVSQQLVGRAAAAVNQALLLRNWLVGAYIVEFEQNGEDRAKYGEMLLARLSRDLNQRGVKGVSRDMLERMRRFFVCYPQIGEWISASAMRKSLPLPAVNLGPPSISASVMRKSAGGLVSEIPSTVLTELPALMFQSISSPPVQKSAADITPLSANAMLQFSWTHLIELIRLDDPLKRAFYENECLKGNWSVRQLQRQIGSLLFERTGLSKNKAAVVARARKQEPQQNIEDLIRDPYVLEFTGLGERPEYTESELETALLNHLQKFLLELGAGFLFEARQRRITVGREHDYIDLVFYHRHLRCHVLLDLKIRAFQHGDAGQMNFYLNWWRENVTAPNEQPPVGIILCSDKDHTKVQFATAGMSNKLFVSRYLAALPSAEQLQRFVEADRDRIEAATKRRPRITPAKPTGRRAPARAKKSRTRQTADRVSATRRRRKRHAGETETRIAGSIGNK